MNYHSLSDHMKETFGTKVYKLSLSAGCTCPNRDGTLGSGGCTFCSEGGSGDFAEAPAPIAEQIKRAKSRVNAKIPARIPENERRYIAYFQSFTNTYGDHTRLRDLFFEAASFPEIAAVSIGTRPDCLPDEILDMLSELNRVKPVWIELGLQTIHERTAYAFHRGYTLPVFEDAYRRLRERGITVIVHVIFGLPGETREDMLETVAWLAGLSPRLDGIKLQLLHILEGTQMAEQYKRDPFPLLTLEEYTDLIVTSLKMLPPETVIHRMTGDGPKSKLIGPTWSADKKRVLNTLTKAIREA